jgi:hypothetical protein
MEEWGLARRGSVPSSVARGTRSRGSSGDTARTPRLPDPLPALLADADSVGQTAPGRVGEPDGRLLLRIDQTNVPLAGSNKLGSARAVPRLCRGRRRSHSPAATPIRMLISRRGPPQESSPAPTFPATIRMIPANTRRQAASTPAVAVAVEAARHARRPRASTRRRSERWPAKLPTGRVTGGLGRAVSIKSVPAPRSTKRAAYCVPSRARLSPLGKIRRRIRKCLPRHHKRASR